MKVVVFNKETYFRQWQSGGRDVKVPRKRKNPGTWGLDRAKLIVGQEFQEGEKMQR